MQLTEKMTRRMRRRNNQRIVVAASTVPSVMWVDSNLMVNIFFAGAGVSS
jgi:hypothetical protein